MNPLEKIKQYRDTILAWMVVCIAVLVAAILLVFVFERGSRLYKESVTDERLETISDSLAKNKILIERIEGQLDELHVQDSLIALQVSQSKARVIVLRQKLANPEIQPFRDASEAKDYLLKKIQSQESK